MTDTNRFHFTVSRLDKLDVPAKGTVIYKDTKIPSFSITQAEEKAKWYRVNPNKLPILEHSSRADQFIMASGRQWVCRYRNQHFNAGHKQSICVLPRTETRADC